MKHAYLEMISRREPVVFDGPMGTEIQKLEPSKEDFGGYTGCNEYLNISRPDIIEAVFIRYLEAGAHVVKTNTFGGSRIKLSEFGLDKRVHEINKAAAVLARQAIEKAQNSGRVDNRQRFVSGCIGPTGFLPSSSDNSLSAITFDELVNIYEEQAAGLLDGGAEIFLIETSQDLLELRAAIVGVRGAMRKVEKNLPVQVQITMDASGKMLLGSDISAFLGAVQGMGVDVVGLNCSSGPDEMAPRIEELLKLSNIPVSMLPNAGLPCNENGKAVYKMGADEFAKKVSAFVVDKGVSVVGGCCGTTPEHIGALAKMLDNKKVADRDSEGHGCFLSTGISGVNLETMKKPIIIGERLNAQGSKKAKEFIVSRNYDELEQIVKEQEAHCGLVDICVAANELDISEAEMMGNVITVLRDRVKTPFCIDSTEPKVLCAALEKSPGAALINSINLEHGGARARKILSLAAKFGCPVIALTIDDKGMAATAERKFEVACELRKLACDEFGLPEHFLYIDPLVFTLATGDADTANAANESLSALRMIKERFKNIRTVMGVSNVSFGLKPKARRVLNNLMLHYASQAGLDAAIFNPQHIDDVNKYDSEIRKLADDLLLNRCENSLQNYVEYFEKLNAELKSTSKTSSANDVEQAPEERLHNAVLNRDKRNLATLIDALLKKHSASDILNTILLPAMSEVGNRMASGDMILPFVLQAAEVMREAVTILEPHLKDGGGANKGKMIIATVYGDVHDIGKNLVASILRNQGFDVIDLGKQVSVDTIIENVKREKPDVLGLSALLVTTSQQMAICVKEFAKENINIPIIIGGAAVNKEFAARISTLDDGNSYAGGVFYAKDAFDVVKIFDALREGKPLEQNTVLIDKNKIAQAFQTEHNKNEIKYDYLIEPPFYGTSEILTWDAETLLSYIDKEFLFKAYWGGGKLTDSDYASAREKEFEPALEKLSSDIINNSLLEPRAFYGFFSCISEDEKIIVLDASDNRTEKLSFTFPRVIKNSISLADYVRPEGDVLSVQAVTIGAKLGDKCRELLLNKNCYTEGFYLNALGNYLTELLAGKVTNEIRRALGLPKNGGRRYSFGYNAMPDLKSQAQLIEFTGVIERLGITLTDGFQMQPEHSTVAIFISHPNAPHL